MKEHIGKEYRVIYADPPWSYKFTSPTGSRRPTYCNGASDYYDVMSLDEIKALPIAQCAARDSVCFMWTTVPMLPDALATLNAWGFKYKTMLTWHKLRCKGMGYWFRGHTEHVLFGVRGRVKAFRSLRHNIVAAKVFKHSQKPHIFYEYIESVVDGPRLEMFARNTRSGWQSWGNEAPATHQERARARAL